MASSRTDKLSYFQCCRITPTQTSPTWTRNFLVHVLAPNMGSVTKENIVSLPFVPEDRSFDKSSLSTCHMQSAPGSQVGSTFSRGVFEKGDDSRSRAGSGSGLQSSQQSLSDDLAEIFLGFRRKIDGERGSPPLAPPSPSSDAARALSRCFFYLRFSSFLFRNRLRTPRFLMTFRIFCAFSLNEISLDLIYDSLFLELRWKCSIAFWKISDWRFVSAVVVFCCVWCVLRSFFVIIYFWICSGFLYESLDLEIYFLLCLLRSSMFAAFGFRFVWKRRFFFPNIVRCLIWWI